MVTKTYIPEQGDIVYFDFSPTNGREQKGVRPALVISRAILNKKNGLVVVIPITSQQKGYPFEVEIKAAKISGVALVDQVRSMDYVARKFKRVSRISETAFEEVRAKFMALAQ